MKKIRCNFSNPGRQCHRSHRKTDRGKGDQASIEISLIECASSSDPLLAEENEDFLRVVDHFGIDLEKSRLLSQLKTESVLKQDSFKDSDTASDDLSVPQILKVIGSSCLRKMIPQVCRLGFLYSVSPASTATCERSFSHLRRVKSYMRAAMGQKRLNHSCIGLLNVYNEELDSLNRTDIVNDFIFANEQRRKIFAIVQK